MLESREDLDNEIKIKKEAAQLENPDCIPENIRLFQIKRDLILSPDPPDNVNDYMELVVQFGFITMFSFVFPLAPFLSLLANLLEINT